MSVSINLFDLGAFESENDTEQDTVAPLTAHATAVDRLYASVSAEVGRHRLRTYLREHHAHYLPGYLAVRAVVARWRESLDEPLSGSKAARILLHLTRFGVAEAVPDLALSLKKFRDQALAAWAMWLDTAAATSAADLRACADGFEAGALENRSEVLLWRHGKLVRVTEDKVKPEADSRDRLRRLLERALGVVTKQVVHGKPADGWLSGEGGVPPVAVIEVQPAGQRGGALP